MVADLLVTLLHGLREGEENDSASSDPSTVRFMRSIALTRVRKTSVCGGRTM